MKKFQTSKKHHRQASADEKGTKLDAVFHTTFKELADNCHLALQLQPAED
jgi:hypothetical protein